MKCRRWRESRGVVGGNVCGSVRVACMVGEGVGGG